MWRRGGRSCRWTRSRPSAQSLLLLRLHVTSLSGVAAHGILVAASERSSAVKDPASWLDRSCYWSPSKSTYQIVHWAHGHALLFFFFRTLTKAKVLNWNSLENLKNDLLYNLRKTNWVPRANKMPQWPRKLPCGKKPSCRSIHKTLIIKIQTM